MLHMKGTYNVNLEYVLIHNMMEKVRTSTLTTQQ